VIAEIYACKPTLQQGDDETKSVQFKPSVQALRLKP